MDIEKALQILQSDGKIVHHVGSDVYMDGERYTEVETIIMVEELRGDC